MAPILSEKLYRILTGEESVHLADWPSIPEAYADDKLIADVELVRRVIRLTRSIREKQKVKNRQPLSLMQIALNDPAGAQVVASFADIIKEELNVKELEILDDVDHIATVSYKPCFPVIGQKYPAQRPAIIKAVQTGKFTLDGGKVILDLNGEKQAFDEDILLISYNAKPGMHVVSESGAVVSLDLNITDELRQEGLARDIVRNIQDARKAQNYNITDRITIAITGGALPEEWVSYICGETLATVGEVASPDATVTVEGEGKENIEIAIAKQ